MNKNYWFYILTSLFGLFLYSSHASAKVACGDEETGACESTTAKFVRGIKDHDSCKDGGFVDPINGGECWVCPEGFERSWRPVTDKNAACIKPSKKGHAYKPAENFKTTGLKCPGDQFFDSQNNGECWSCPKGFENVVLNKIGEFNKCRKIENFKKATYHSTLKSSCGKGQFADPNGECYSCPTGYNRTGHPVTSSKACSTLVEKRSKGKRMRAAGFLGADCKKGEIYDVGEGACFTCPAGYFRSGAPITASNACTLDREKLVAAKSHGKLAATCPSGQFSDPNGKCYSCPAGYDRSGHSIDSAKACSKEGKEKFSRATLESKHCDPAEGKFPDLGQCWQCPAGYDRGILPVTSPAACVTNAAEIAAAEFLEPWGCDESKGEFWDSYNKGGSKLGTCWSCPDQFSRGMSSVTSKNACESNDFRWKNDPYPEPGLLGLIKSGSNTSPFTTLLMEWFQDEAKIATITDFLYQVAEQKKLTGRKADKYVADEWKSIAKFPENNANLQALIFATLETVAMLPDKDRSDLENDMISSFEDYIYARKLFISQQAQKAYNAWKSELTWRQSQDASSTKFSRLFASEPPPPDFTKIAEDTIKVGRVSGAILTSMAVMNVALAQSSGKGFKVLVTNLFPYAVSRMTQKVTEEAAKKLVSSSFAMLNSAGPQIIITIALIIADVRMNQVIDIANAPLKLQEAVDYATRTRPDLTKMFKSDEGVSMAMQFWSLAMVPFEGKTEQGTFIAFSNNTLASMAKQAAKKQMAATAAAADEPVAASASSGEALYTAAITDKNGNTFLYGVDGTYSRSSKASKKGFDKGYPKEMPGGWKNLPDSWLNGIDAGLPRKGKTPYLWKDSQYVRLKDTTVENGYPKDMPGDWKKLPKAWGGDVDAAFYYAPSKKHYMFKGNQYVRLNDITVDKGYPLDLPGGWEGMPANFAKGIDAATFRNGHIYMIKGDEYIRFTKTKMDKGYPKKIKGNWPE